MWSRHKLPCDNKIAERQPDYAASRKGYYLMKGIDSRLADQIYRAVVDVADRLGNEPPPGAESLQSSLISVMAERRLAAEPVADWTGAITVEHAQAREGITIGTLPDDTGDRMIQHAWRRVHHLTFGERSLRIQTLDHHNGI